MSRFDADADFFGSFDENPTEIWDQEQEKDKVFKTVQLVDELTALYKARNSENEEEEEQISMAPENEEESTQKIRFESEARAKKEKQEKINKLLKTGGILILCFLLLNCVLVLIVMNRTSEFSSPFSTEEFSAWENQTNETGKIVGDMKFELDRVEKWINSTEEKLKGHHVKVEALLNQTEIDQQLEALKKENEDLQKSHAELTEQFESLSQKLEQLENNNISSLPTPPPAENENEEIIDPDPESLKNCRDAMENLPSPRSKKQRIYPHGSNRSLEVVCDFEVDGGGWTIIQKRSSGPKQEFNQTWNKYANGFGSLDKNFWIGLENIHALTKNGDQELRIELEDFGGNKKWTKYSSFSISDASDLYRLSISGFYENSTAGDSMTSLSAGHGMNNGQRFSTKDEDNDVLPWGHCAAEYFGDGGWWFSPLCGASGLNGLYFEKEKAAGHYDGILWHSWKGYYSSLAKTEMKIRPRQ